jgi:hypothetical protein
MQHRDKTYPWWHCATGVVSFRAWSRDSNGDLILPKKGNVLAICSNRDCPGPDEGKKAA